MDIKKFNKVLSTKIAKAKSFENHGDLDIAIELWIEISDLTLKASKQPDLDFTYRHMLISKTEQIIDHVKELKNPKKEIPIVKDIKIQDDNFEIPEIKNEINLKEAESNKIEDDQFIADFSHTRNQKAEIKHKVIEDSDFKNIPDGIKEIEPSKDFEIITPHDPNYVEKMEKLSKEVDMNTYKKPKGEPSNEEVDLGDKKICFACGTILPPKTEICTECGTKLS
jgi:hypothetical protein